MESDIEILFQDDPIALHKPALKSFPRRYVFSPHVDAIFGSDLMFIGKKAYLIVIDFFSKYLFVRPVNDTKSITISKALLDIFKKSGRKPEKLNTDMGSEYKKETQAMLKQQGIDHYFSTNETKVPIAERVIRTLKSRIARYEDSTGKSFIPYLPELIEGYNNSFHSSIKMTPTEASLKENHDIAFKNLYGKHKNIYKQPKYKVGDLVLISTIKNFFDKESVAKWSTERFIIDEVLTTTPTTYRIRDKKPKSEVIQGTFYEAELQLTK